MGLLPFDLDVLAMLVSPSLLHSQRCLLTRGDSMIIQDSSVSTPTSSHGTLSHSQTPTASSFAQQDTNNNTGVGGSAGGGGAAGRNNKKGNKKSAVNTPGAGPGGEDAAENEGQGPRKRPKFTFGGRVAGDG